MFISGSEIEQKELQDIINKLLSVNFLVKELDRTSYYLANRHKHKLEEFFKFLGWDFVIDDRHETIFVASPKGLHRKRLSREESIWLLVLRIIYQEKREGLSLSEFPITTLYEIKAKYETFRLPSFTKSKVNEYIRLCVRYQLMQPIDSDLHSDDCRFRLFHSWLHMIDSESIQQLNDKISRYELGIGEGDENEMDEETEAD
ncbi:MULTISPECIES: DUF4194 domain-containing protein [Bacillaceae]|uniref:DUF4194 domain-containing protein n=1 Tax=Bacillaceae TaxID=186817 RepID=UPI000B44DF8C|nr:MULTISPECIES: DUF4194 domain-containing protein [Bacillaceae]